MGKELYEYRKINAGLFWQNGIIWGRGGGNRLTQYWGSCEIVKCLTFMLTNRAHDDDDEISVEII